MRSVFAISTAIALFASTALAAQNADFEAMSFAADEAAAAPAAAPAALTDSFVTFRWKGESNVAAETFNLNLDSAARIQVTDFKNRGDMFEIFDNGKSLGKTTKVEIAKDDQVFAATPEEALKDDRFSKGIFDLAKGEHKITIKASGPYEAGTAAIRVLDHANVAFHKKNKNHRGGDDDKKKHKGDDDEEDNHKKWGKDDDDEDDERDSHGRWRKGGDDGDDEDYKYGKHKWHKKPTHEEIDFSHTVTYTKTKWVKPTPH